MTEAPEPFWMIAGIGQGVPSQKHDTADKARAEAKRLARNNPGVTFVILESVAAITKREFDVVTFRAPPRVVNADDDIPF